MLRLITAVVIVALGGHDLAFQGSSTAHRPAATKFVREATCAASLGTGIKSNRAFCDVLVATSPDKSVGMSIPSHTGTATLMFDLHNRFSAQEGGTDPGQAFQRHTVTVAVIRPNGDVIDRAMIVGEFRTAQDLFDRIAGTGPTGVKAVAPGPAQPVRVTIPAGVSSIGIVGVRQDIDTRSAHAAFTTPGRPVAIVSNMRIEYK